MKIIDLPLSGAAEIQNSLHKDQRGWFSRYYCEKELSAINGERKIVQINSSLTKLTGAIRGFHFQYFPHQEDKFIKCVEGKIFDVMVDVRLGSATFGQWHAVVLESNKNNMVYLPKGFAHGYQTLEPNCQILYFHTQFYAPRSEGGYRYDSPQLNIPWPLEVTEVSRKDKNLDFFCSMGSQKQNAM